MTFKPMRLWLAFLALVPAWAQATIHYKIKPDPGARNVRVEVRAEAKGRTTFTIPAWCPGFYFILNYQDKMSDVGFTDASGKAIPFERQQRSWTIDHSGPVTMAYTVEGDDPGLGFFGVNVRGHTAFLNGPAAFVYVEGRKEEPCHLEVDQPADWDVAVALDRLPDGKFVAADYDEFIDSPIRLGKFERVKFTVEGVPFEAIFVSTNQRYNPDLAETAKMFAAVSRPVMEMYGKPYPFKRYIYFVHLAIGGFGGGLEHRASTVLAVPNMARLGIETLAAHEFVHTWNVKQYRPLPLGPFDYTQPARTGNLWMAEGVTDYYAQIACYRSGLFDEAWLLRQLGNEIAGLQRGKTRLTKTAEDASREAWENGGFGVGDLSFYTKGLVAGFVFDAAIRGAAEGKKSLDDVMRLMNAKYRLPNPGYDEDAPKRHINEVAGRDLSKLYDTIIRSTAEIPYEEVRAIGLRVLEPGKTVPDLGIAVVDGKVTAVDPDATPGLAVGDVLVEVDGKAYAAGAFSPEKTSYAIAFEREGARRTATLTATTKTARRWTVERDPFATATAQARLAEFLKR